MKKLTLSAAVAALFALGATSAMATPPGGPNGYQNGNAWASYGGMSGGMSGGAGYGDETWAGSGQDNTQAGGAYVHQNTDGPDTARARSRVTSSGGSGAGAYSEDNYGGNSAAGTMAGGLTGGSAWANAGENNRNRPPRP